MSKIRVCIGSNDNGNTIAKSHMGDTDYFYIYDIYENQEIKFVEKRENIAKSMEHAKSNKMQSILNLLNDVDIFVAYQISPNFIKIAKNTKHQPVIIKADNIADILSILTKNFKNLTIYIQNRKNGEFLETIPQLT